VRLTHVAPGTAVRLKTHATVEHREFHAQSAIETNLHDCPQAEALHDRIVARKEDY